MTTVAVEQLDSHRSAREIVDAVHAGDMASAMNTVGQMTQAELVSITVLFASLIDVGKPLLSASASSVSRPTINTITVAANMVCAIYQIEPRDLYGGSRREPVANARHVLCAVASWSGVTAKEIGRVIDRDHSTVLNSIRRAESSTELSEQAHRIMLRIQEGRPTA